MLSAAILGAVLMLVKSVPSAVAFVPDFIEWGSCSTIHLQPDFDPIKYQGWWWDIMRVPNQYQKTSSCINQNVTWIENSLEVQNRGLTADGVKTGTYARMKEDPVRSPVPHPAHMKVFSEGVPEAPYRVMSTDYVTYSCVYSCLQFPGVFAEFFWIIGRKPSIPQEYVETCMTHFKKAGINTDKLVHVEQGKTCPYYSSLDEKLAFNKLLLSQLIPTTSPETMDSSSEQTEVMEETNEVVTSEVPDDLSFSSTSGPLTLPTVPASHPSGVPAFANSLPVSALTKSDLPVNEANSGGERATITAVSFFWTLVTLVLCST